MSRISPFPRVHPSPVAISWIVWLETAKTMPHSIAHEGDNTINAIGLKILTSTTI